jgi:hypothetical protein
MEKNVPNHQPEYVLVVWLLIKVNLATWSVYNKNCSWSRDWMKCIHAIQCSIMQSYAIVSHNFNFWFRLLLRFKHAYFLTNPALLQQLQPFHTKTPQVPLCGSACMLPHAHGTPTFSFKTFSRLLKPSARQYLGHKLYNLTFGDSVGLQQPTRFYRKMPIDSQ